MGSDETMKLFKTMKDGGPLSRVWGYFLIEWKRVFSIALLRFEDGSREAFHTHAFNAVSWVLKGRLMEVTRHCVGLQYTFYKPSWRPIFTPRERMHKVKSIGTTWVLTFRGPWVDQWKEWLPEEQQELTLTHGRREVCADDPVDYYTHHSASRGRRFS
jgi:hypothetical protein